MGSVRGREWELEWGKGERTTGYFVRCIMPAIQLFPFKPCLPSPYLPPPPPCSLPPSLRPPSFPPLSRPAFPLIIDSLVPPTSEIDRPYINHATSTASASQTASPALLQATAFSPPVVAVLILQPKVCPSMPKHLSPVQPEHSH